VVRSRAALHLEVFALRHQLQVLQRSRPRRLRLAKMDRWLWALLSRSWSGWRTALVIVKPETVIAWHRQGFRLFWTWKSRRRGGRPPVPPDVRILIWTMSRDNPLWGAPRTHGELLKLGIDVCQASVAKSMMRRDRLSSQTWRTFLKNHLQQIAAADFFVVPTATCRLMFVLVILAHERRRVVHVAITITRRPRGRRNNSAKRFPGTRRRDIWFAIAIQRSTRGRRQPRRSALRKSSRLHAHRGRTHTPSA
jgi:putative transposase